jgi:hypothetical protein
MVEIGSSSLSAFVRSAKLHGIGDGFIVSLLKNSGWTERRIFAAFTEVYEGELGEPIPSRGSRIEYARDAFLYLLAFFSLGVWTVALGSIFYRLIDRWVPNPLDPAYAAAYTIREISWQIAAIVVAYPLFLFVTRFSLKEIARRPELLDSGVRKWLTNLALVIAAVIVVGDLVSFVATFLQGDLTARFAADVLVVFVLASGVFGYYLRSLREGSPANVQRAFFAASLALVVAGLAGGFSATGTPENQRQRAFDDRRVENLSAIAAIVRRNEGRDPAHPVLPADGTALRALAEKDGGTAEMLADPQTLRPYEYTRITPGRYRLCASFSADAFTDTTLPLTWRHPAGQYCFEFNAEDAVTPVYRR